MVDKDMGSSSQPLKRKYLHVELELQIYTLGPWVSAL